MLKSINFNYKNEGINIIIRYNQKHLDTISSISNSDFNNCLLLSFLINYFDSFIDSKLDKYALINHHFKCSITVEIEHQPHEIIVTLLDVLSLENIIVSKWLDTNTMDIAFSNLKARKYVDDDNLYCDDAIQDYSNNIVNINDFRV